MLAVKPIQGMERDLCHLQQEASMFLFAALGALNKRSKGGRRPHALCCSTGFGGTFVHHTDNHFINAPEGGRKKTDRHLLT